VRGKVAHVDGTWNVPQPVQRGGPKILIGGGGERKTLRLTARYADLWNGFGDPATVRHKLDVLREHCEAVGRDPGEIVTTRLGTLIVAETMADAERRKRAWQEQRGVPDDSIGARLWWGDADAIRAQAEAARRGPRRTALQHAGGVIPGGRSARRRGPRAAPLIEPTPGEPSSARLPGSEELEASFLQGQGLRGFPGPHTDDHGPERRPLVGALASGFDPATPPDEPDDRDRHEPRQHPDRGAE
jgi:hypothetical protein